MIYYGYKEGFKVPMYVSIRGSKPPSYATMRGFESFPCML